MKLRNWITLGCIVSASTMAVACGGKNDGNGGDTSGDGDGGGNGNGDGDSDGDTAGTDLSALEDDIAALEKLVADLQEQIDSASDQEIPDLQDDLDAANARIDELETCANGGSCEGVESVIELSALTDSYCEWVFGCCSTDEARATLGNAANDEAGCKDMFQGLLLRTGSSISAPGLSTSDSYSLGQLAARLQGGRIELNSEALEECAAEQAAMPCADADPIPALACGEGTASACGDIYNGLQENGESCSFSDDCVDGLFCTGGNGYQDGVCLPGAQVDDSCQEENDCLSAEGELFCDETSGTCQTRADEGDDCIFADATFNQLPPSTLTLPCMPGYWCSLETATCLAACDILAEGDICSDSTQCGDEMYCDFASLSNQGYAGSCKEKLAPGAASTMAEACLSGSIYSDLEAATRCTGSGGDECIVADYAGADCNSGSCDDDAEECRTKCVADYDCAGNETCVNAVCYASVTSHADCVVTEQCPADEFCEAGTCTDRVKTGDREDTADDCAANEECTIGSACIDGDCVPFEGLGTDAYCTDWYHCTSGRCELDSDSKEESNKCIAAATLGDEGDDCDMKDLAEGDINSDPCKSGLYCKRSAPNSTSNYEGTCAKQLEPGQACDQSIDPAVNQCVGNEYCTTNPATSVLSCRVPYSEPDQNDKCVLGSSTFAVSVAYGDFALPL